MVATTDKTGLCIGRIVEKNYKRVEAQDVTLDGNHLVIAGPNGSGKSSFVDALWETLYKSSRKDTPEPIRHGADKAQVRLELIDRQTKKPRYVVERNWTEKRTTLTVTAPDGSTFRNGDELLKGLVDEYALNPVAFLQQKPRDQIDDILKVCGVSPPVDKVREITGEDDKPVGDESAASYLDRLSADETGVYYRKRRDAHRVAMQKQAALEESKRELEALGGPLSPAEQPASVAELLQKVEGLNQKTYERRAVRDRADKLATIYQDGNQQLERVRGELASKEKEAAGIKAEIERLQARLKDVNGEADALVQRIKKGLTAIEGAKAAADAAMDAWRKLPDPAPQIAEARRQIADMEKGNAKQQKRQQASETVDRLTDDWQQAAKEHGRLELVMTKLRDERANLLNDVDLGVQSLSISDGELRLGGVPFRQASQAEKIRVACAIAFRRNPELKLLRLDGAEALDSESQRILFEMADRYSWQCVLTFVRDGDALKVEIVPAEGAAA